MVFAGLLGALGRASVAPLMSSVCSRYDAATGWQPAGTFRCAYEEGFPETAGLGGFEGSSFGYGINLFCPFDQPLNSQDRVGVDGLTLEVQRVAIVNSIGDAKRAFCVKRGA